jgi:microcystin-dependent protein
MPSIPQLSDRQLGSVFRASLNSVIDHFNQTGLSLSELPGSGILGGGPGTLWRTLEGDKLVELPTNAVAFDIQIAATSVKLARIDRRTPLAAAFWSTKPDGTLFLLEDLYYTVSSGATDIPDLPNLLPAGTITTGHFGDTADNTADNLPAITACMNYAGVNGTWAFTATKPGSWTRIGSTYTDELSLSIRGQTIIASGVVLSNPVEVSAEGITTVGNISIDGNLRTGPKPWFGLVLHKSSGDTSLNFSVKNCFVDVVAGGVKGVYADGANISVVSESCGFSSNLAYDIGATASGLICHVPAIETAYGAPIISVGGSYDDGQWIAPATGGSGSGAYFGLRVSGGSVVDVTPLVSGEGYEIDDVLSFSPASALDVDGTAMTGGSGFTYIVKEIYGSDPSAVEPYLQGINLAIDCKLSFYGGLVLNNLIGGKISGSLKSLKTYDKPYLSGASTSTQFTLNIDTDNLSSKSPSGLLVDLQGSTNALFQGSRIVDLRKSLGASNDALEVLADLGTGGKFISTSWIVSDDEVTVEDRFGALRVSSLVFDNGDNLVDLVPELSQDLDFLGVDPLKLATRQTIANYVKNVVPAGTVMMFAASTPPTGWLKANGAELSRTVFSDLYDAIGVTHGAGDGTSTFNLPDLRAAFIRGWDDGLNVDASRVFASLQLDAFQGHFHDYSAGAAGNNSLDIRFSYHRTSNNSVTTTNGYTGDYSSDGTNGVPRVAGETRPRNIALLACIKF